MTSTPRTPVDPALLRWARESIGMSDEESAKKINVHLSRLQSWEVGEASPTLAQLRNLARVYKRPLAVFFLPAPPRDFRPLHDFRRLPDVETAGWSPALRLAVRRALQQQEAVTELRGLLGDEDPPVPTAHPQRDDPERFAQEARSLLGVSLDEQRGWRDQYKALAGWIGALEDAGVLVLQASDVSLTEMRGFSVTDSIPLVVLNGSDAPRARIFTAMHEWAHLLLNEAGVCDLHESNEDHDDEVERFCNEVAGAILMPADAFAREAIVREARDIGELSDQAIATLANRYSVSKESVVRRLVSLGAVPWTFYIGKRGEYEHAYARKRAEASGFAPYHLVRVRDLGRAYVRLVLEAYHEDRINVSEVSDYLGVRLKHLPKIERETLPG